MTKVPDDERILEILRRGGYDISDDWAWISHYLELADKCLNLGNKTPPGVRDKIRAAHPHAGRDRQPAVELAGTADDDTAEAQQRNLNPARKQSA
jgi:hypothetical protein